MCKRLRTWQVNLEHLSRVVFEENGLLYSDTLVGADSHTTLINGLGILGWGMAALNGRCGGGFWMIDAAIMEDWGGAVCGENPCASLFGWNGPMEQRVIPCLKEREAHLRRVRNVAAAWILRTRQSLFLCY
jgi:hypothetical protein